MIENKYLIYFNTKTGLIYHLEKIVSALPLNEEASIELFKNTHNLQNQDIAFKYYDFEEYDKLYISDLKNLYYIDVKDGNRIAVDYAAKQRVHTSYLYNLMDPKRPYTKDQVEEMYYEHYLNINIKNILKHPDKHFVWKFLPLEDLDLRVEVMSKNWSNHFYDPFLEDYGDEKIKLAESIMEKGTYFPVQVTENEDWKTYTVREGNHRIASLKLGQLYGIVPPDYKILCFVVEHFNYSAAEKTINGLLSQPIYGCQNIDPVFGSITYTNDRYYNKIKDSISKSGYKMLNEYTYLMNTTQMKEAYDYIYIYPLFLRDLLYRYPEIKPADFLNNEELFEKWLKE